MTAYRELIERLEKSEAFSVAIDRDIHAALVAQVPKGYTLGSSSGAYIIAHNRAGRIWNEKVPPYTASIDAALSLSDMAMSGWDMEIYRDIEANLWTVGVAGPSVHQYSSGQHKRGAIAILICLLRALEAQSKDKEEEEA